MKNKKIAIIGLSGQSIFMEVDNFHKAGETIQANNLHIEPGGKGYNQAIACARLGLDVSYLTAVGDDDYAKICEQYMKSENIDTYYCIKDDSTPVATIITNKYGDNQVTVYKGASEKLSLKDLELFYLQIKNSDILLVNNEIPYDVLEQSIKYASSHNKYVILNPAPAIYDISNLLPYINLLIPNEIEAKTIFKKEINNININNNLKVIITLGEKGCLYIDKDNKKYYNAIKTNNVIDTTGAGDVFCAAIAATITTLGIEDAIVIATKASSKHIQKKYVMNAIPKKSEL